MLTENKKQILLWGHENLKHIFIPIMRRYAIWTPLPVVPVGGYPKSGTTWVARMVAHYLDLPLIMASDLAFGFEYVVHHHWGYHKSLDHSIQVVRDGRDVMVSVYMNLMKGYTAMEKALSTLASHQAGRILRGNIGLYARRKKRFERIWGKNFDPWDVEKNLPAFIEHELQKPFLPAVRKPWPQYVRAWMRQGKRTTFVKYEELISDDGPAVLASLLSEYTDQAIRAKAIHTTYERYHFKNITGRTPGQENRSSFARKGIAGDWKNYFTPSARKIFQRYAGDVLIELGYEQDDSWAR